MGQKSNMTDDYIANLQERHDKYKKALEIMAKVQACDCGCPSGMRPVLLKPQHYYAIAREALRIGADESQDDYRAGVCAHSHVKTSNSEANLVCCDLASIPNAEREQ